MANQISNVVLVAGVHAVKLQLLRNPAGQLSGHVFQDGPAIPVENAGDVPDVLPCATASLRPTTRCWLAWSCNCATA